jgi:hypothetical protein
MPNCTLGFSSSIDISATSSIAGQHCKIGVAVKVQARLHNLSCTTAQAGSVDFFWCTAPGGTLIPIDDIQSGSNNAPAKDSQGNQNINPGSSKFATIYWIPDTATVGTPAPGGYVVGYVVVLAHSLANGVCAAFDPPSPPVLTDPYAMTSGAIDIFSAS